jgi:hypothetical protein
MNLQFSLKVLGHFYLRLIDKIPSKIYRPQDLTIRNEVL